MIEKMKITRWSLERVQFVLSHVEDFIDDDAQETRDRAKNFVAQQGLEQVQNLAGCEPQDPHLPTQLLERLSPFFDSGVLFQRGADHDTGGWWVTDLFYRGTAFHLEPKDQVNATPIVPMITPLQVHRAPAKKVMSSLRLDFLCPAKDADAFLVKPTPTTAFVLISNFPAPWTEDHVAQAHRLINKCFIY